MWDMNRGEDENRKKRNVPISATQAGNLTEHHHSHSSSNSGGDGEQQVKFENKTELESQSCGIDSGFMSGPQLSVYDSSDDSDHREEEITTERSKKKINTLTGAAVTGKEYSDSGCAEDDNIATDSGLLLEGTSKHMILDSGVDTGSGLSDWFCNLSLKDNNKLNDLSSTKKSLGIKESNNDENRTENKQQKQPWQIYYQQNADGDTQLHIACITGYINVISALIQLAPHPCLLDIQNDEALTALHIAVLTGQSNIVRMLLIGGASATIRDRNGNTPLHLACSFGDMECMKALTTPITLSEVQQTNLIFVRKSEKPLHLCSKLPQDLELRNYEGEQCVHLAAQNNHIDVLRHLVSIGADINAREGKSGLTPLHIAIEMCNETLANFLLEECQKLNLETATYAGLTAYQLAAMIRFSPMQLNLEKHGAEPLTPPESDQESDSETELNDSQSQPYNRFGEHFFGSSHNGSNAINVS